MTNLEQEFFKTFGIEPEYTYIGHYPLTDENGIIQPPTYPEITDRVLLELICILNSYYSNTMQCCTMLTSKNIYELKNEILKELIDILKQYTSLSFLEKDRDEREEENWIKQQIQSLFREGEE